MKNRPYRQPASSTTARPRAAFTLLELTVSLSITSILLVAVGSAIVLAAKAIPNAQDQTNVFLTSGKATDDLVSELQFALGFTQRTANTVEFTVADRDGDTVDETIRYEWSGTAGDPLTRQYNGGPVVPIIDQVQDLAFLYDWHVVSELVPTEVESPEVELARYSSASNPTAFAVTKLNWIGQYFAPTGLPAPATSWKVTRVVFQAKKSGIAIDDGVTMVQLRTADASNFPSGLILEQVPLAETSLTAGWTWENINFSNVEGIDPADGLCLVFEWISGVGSADILYDPGAVGRVKTSDGGANWTSPPDAMLYYVYGTSMSPGPMDTIYHNYLTGIRITIDTGTDASTQLETGVALLRVQEMVP